MSLNQNENPRSNKQDLCDVPIPFSVWKELPQLQHGLGVLCSTGLRKEGVRWTDQNLAAGKRPRK